LRPQDGGQLQHDQRAYESGYGEIAPKPFPHAVDDHQTTNARFVVDAGGGWLLPQSELTPEGLAALLQGLDRAQLIVRAQVAKSLQKTEATTEVVAACEALAS
jgi:UDP-N-acetylglucosamine--N-acetylmuramyl-(pentapeptide) pyrophosphoryl-undecaprenol N-acetylglucosamine transferase